MVHLLALVRSIVSSTSLGVFSGYGYAEDIASMGGQVWVQFVGVIATIAFTAALTWGILKAVGAMTGGLRVSEEQEVEGLDHISHEETGYNML